MLTSRRLSAAAAATAAATLTLAVGSAAARPLFQSHGYPGPEGAVFVQTDNTAGNAIAVYDRGHNGTLSAAGTYATGGKGGMLQGSQVDHLASQNSLVYDAGAAELFAVNAGSNTVSTFAVNGDRLHLRQVVGSGGSFPVSIAVHGDLVYVLNAVGGGTIQGYRLINGFLAPIPGSSRALGLDPNETPQFTSTPGDIAFTPDGRDLLVTTKNNENDIDVFAVNFFGLPSATPVVNSEPNDVPFALAFEGNNQVDVGEAGPNAVASFALHANGTLQPLDSVLTGGAATCWIVADGPVLFAGNAGSAAESSLLASPFGDLVLTATTTTDPGTVDAATSPDGRYLYVQTGGNGIVDEFRVGLAGTLTEVGSVTVPNAIGGQGIATS
jgi:6-phosphogluconolactonase (cycloisomerase 2 family)